MRPPPLSAKEEWNGRTVLFRIRMSFIARYVHTFKEFIFMTEATAVQQNNSDRTKTHK